MSELKGKRVLVTGGAGFIGSHIVDLLCNEGCTEIVALDNMVRGRPENLVQARVMVPFVWCTAIFVTQADGVVGERG